MTTFSELFKEGKIENAIALLPRAEEKTDAPAYCRLYRATAGYCRRKEPSSVREIAFYDAGEGNKIVAAALHPNGRVAAIGTEGPGGADLVLLDDSLQVIRHLDVLGPEREKKVVEKLGLWGQDESEHISGKDRLLSAEFSRTGDLLMCRMEHSLQVWDDSKSVTCLHWPAEIDVPHRRAVFTPDENMVLINDNRKVIFRLWDMRTGEVYENINNRSELPFCSDMLYTPDGSSVITIDKKGIIREFNDTAYPCTRYVETGLEGDLSLFMTPDGRNLYISGPEGIDIWDWISRKKTDHLSADLSSAASVSPDGTILAAVKGRNVAVWSIPQKKLLFEISSPEELPAEKLVFSPDGCLLCICRGSRISMHLLNQELVFPGWTDWDEKADPLYDVFLKRCGSGLSLEETEHWIQELRRYGFGFIRREAIIQKVKPDIEKQEEYNNWEDFVAQVREESKADLPAEEKQKLEKNKKTIRDFIGKIILGAVLFAAGLAGFVPSFMIAKERLVLAIVGVLLSSCLLSIGILFPKECRNQIKRN